MEVLRLATVVPLNMPHRLTADVSIDGTCIKKGSVILTNSYFIHRNPACWKDPLKFEPSRFLNAENKVVAKPDAYVPFSIGKLRSILNEVY